jgi:hypothetical protein
MPDFRVLKNHYHSLTVIGWLLQRAS